MAHPRKAMGIGEWGYTSKDIKTRTGMLEEGTKVRVIGISANGFDLEDEYRNCALGCGLDCFQ